MNIPFATQTWNFFTHAKVKPGFHWQINQRKQLREVLEEESLQEAFTCIKKAYQWNEQVFTNWLQKKIKKGLCIGKCLTLIEAALRNTDDGSSFPQEKTLYYQVVEHLEVALHCLNLETPDMQVQQILHELSKNLPQQNEDHLFFSPINKKAEILSFLKKRGVFLIRLYNERLKKGHALLFSVCEKSCWFYESQINKSYQENSLSVLFQNMYEFLFFFYKWSLRKESFWLIQRFT